MSFFTCPWCNRDTFRSRGGLKNHQLHHCQYKPNESTSVAAVPAPQLSEAAKASEDAPSSSSSGAEDDDGSVSVNLVKIARAPTDVNVNKKADTPVLRSVLRRKRVGQMQNPSQRQHCFPLKLLIRKMTKRDMAPLAMMMMLRCQIKHKN